MLNKKDILKNLANYSAEEIAKAVHDDVVSLYELHKESNGAFTPLLRYEVNELLDNYENLINKPNEDKKEDIEVNSIDEIESEDIEVISHDEIENEDIEVISHDEIENEEKEINNHEEEYHMFSKSFSFSGRIGRAEFFFSVLLSSLFQGLLSSIIEATTYNSSDETIAVTVFLCLLLQLPILWFMLAQAAKRCHDLDCNGWFQLIPFFFIPLTFVKGDQTANKYGNPLN